MTFHWPVPGPITRRFDYLSSIYVGGQHAAIDIAAPSGTPIRAIAAGYVRGVGWDQLSGFFVAVTHDGGWRSTCRHLYGQAPAVVGQAVAQDQIIGNIGNTGYSLGPHLHFDLWNPIKQDVTAFAKHGTWAHDPELYLGQGDNMATLLEQHLKDHETFDESIRQLQREMEAIFGRVGELEKQLDAAQAWQTAHGNILHKGNVAPRLKALEEAQGSSGGIKRGDTVELR